MSTNTIVLVTGANRGIGLGIFQALLTSTKPYTLLLTSRDLARGQEAAKSIESDIKASNGSTVVPMQLDIEDDESIAKLYDEVEKQFGRIDALVNNAGAAFDMAAPRLKWSHRKLWSYTYNLNVISTDALTHKFMPLLLQSSNPHLLFLTSTVASLTESFIEQLPYNTPPTDKGWPKDLGFDIPAYRSSKVALNMMGRHWAKNTKADGVIVHLVDPGLVATEFGGGDPAAKALRGAPPPIVPGQLVRRVVEGELDGDAGKVVGLKGVVDW
ncbi:hypothetical protein IAR55_000653 [Kwoniella newhampshirensis]|uniref:Short-chain dehydrogenase n=1 Tax=Kwoniella newhampshirensis TaxID=1651941 RepID=A0AAW0Z7B8_9TREE